MTAVRLRKRATFSEKGHSSTLLYEEWKYDGFWDLSLKGIPSKQLAVCQLSPVLSCDPSGVVPLSGKDTNENVAQCADNGPNGLRLTESWTLPSSVFSAVCRGSVSPVRTASADEKPTVLTAPMLCCPQGVFVVVVFRPQDPVIVLQWAG